MSRYTTQIHKSVAAHVVTATLLFSLLFQALTPVLAYAAESDNNSGNSDQNISSPTLSDQPSESSAENITPNSEDVTQQTHSDSNVENGTSEENIDTGNTTAGLILENKENNNLIDTQNTGSSTVPTTDSPSASSTENNHQTDGAVFSVTATGTTTADTGDLMSPDTSSTTSSTTPDHKTNTSSSTASSTDTVIVETDNDVTIYNTATTTANSGSNVASSTGTSTITTGTAVAYVDVLNVVNTNVINSTGLVNFINDTLGYKDFDLRSDFNSTYSRFYTSQSTNPCELGTCRHDTLYSSTNTADISNNITVIANTGGNEAAGENTTIKTGNAYASANVINVANTNIVDSRYLLLIFNNFDSYTGDIVLPNSDFFQSLLSDTGSKSAGGNININNEAHVENNLNTIADSGGNLAAGSSTAITTGSSTASSNVLNTINRNAINDTVFSMLIRVEGKWDGHISGLPEGLTWRETERGIEIVSQNGLTGLPVKAKTGAVNINNKAGIKNDVQVYALTGDNKAAGENTTIKTGRAYADSSVINIANTNVIGSNWANLIFTIYGDWNGNLTFGQPDLWLGVTAASPDQPTMPGSPVTYTYTVFNRGDTTATDVRLESSFANGLLSFVEGETASDGANTVQSWSLGDIEPGETKEFTHAAYVSSALDSNRVSAIPLTSRVYSVNKDANDTDNEDTVVIYVGEKPSKSTSISKTFAAHFTIEKTASRDLAQPGDTVDYTIELFNRGGQLYDALLVDTLQNEAGEIIQQQSWPLGEIKNWENIKITYSIVFDSSIATGTYTNSAQLVGWHGSRQPKYQTPYESPVASHTLRLGTVPEGQVLGISTDFCPPYLTKYLRYGADNDSNEVRKLQIFLNSELDRSLPVSGVFDIATEQAVRDFQSIYREDVLSPWGLENNSGFVYYTTQKKINEIMCANSRPFPLSAEQQTEIEHFRQQMERYKRLAFNQENTIPPAKPEEAILQTATSTATERKTGQTKGKMQVLKPGKKTPSPPTLWFSITGFIKNLGLVKIFTKR